jgi:hypothetical protein
MKRVNKGEEDNVISVDSDVISGVYYLLIS